MSYRFMRVIVFFDLPVDTASDRKEYTRFRNFLIKRGFLMMQESVYCKLALNQTVSSAVIETLYKNKPKRGLVQAMVITEKQFAGMEMIVGDYNSPVIDSDKRLIIL